MQITSATTAANSVSPLHAAAGYTRAPGQDFLSVLNTACEEAVSPEIPKAEANTAAAQITLLEQYEMITCRTVAEEYPPVAVEKSPVTEESSSLPAVWTDKCLAESVAQSFTGDINYPIDTTKTINWASSGDHKLTAEEIAQLKEKYDVTHLSAQEYYDLMPGLTHMNVLSGNDVRGVFIRQLSPVDSCLFLLPRIREALIQSMGQIGEQIFRLSKPQNRRNTWCISRFWGKDRRKICRRDAPSDLSRGSLAFKKKVCAQMPSLQLISANEAEVKEVQKEAAVQTEKIPCTAASVFMDTNKIDPEISKQT